MAGNEVRAGGFRIGLVEEIAPKTVMVDGRRRSIAVIDMKLDKEVEPLPVDTAVRVRPRSALGLKYVELTPGRSDTILDAGDTIKLENASEPLDLEDVLATFDPPTRRSVREATVGFGDAFAGRGASVNTAIEAFNPLLRSLVPVMSNLAEPDTELDRFFVELGESAAQVAPVAEVQAGLFSKMADTFAAFVEDPDGAPADDRALAADAGRLGRLLPRDASVPVRLRRPRRAPAPRRAGAAALAAADQQRAGRRHAGAAAHR